METVLKEIVEKVHNTVLKARNIEHLVNTDVFKEVYMSSHDRAKKDLNDAIDALDFSRLKDLIVTLKTDELPIKYWCVRRLRREASALGIKHYGNIPSVLLAEAIINKQKQLSEVHHVGRQKTSRKMG